MMRFLITTRPTDHNMADYVELLRSHGVSCVVRACEAGYAAQPLLSAGVAVSDLVFDDGSPPPTEVIEEWMELLKELYLDTPGTCVAVHCVLGLGRAPTLVAIALIELGMRPGDAIELIRQRRRGAMNDKQCEFLRNYSPRSRLRLRTVRRETRKDPVIVTLATIPTAMSSKEEPEGSQQNGNSKKRTCVVL